MSKPFKTSAPATGEKSGDAGAPQVPRVQKAGTPVAPIPEHTAPIPWPPAGGPDDQHRPFKTSK